MAKNLGARTCSEITTLTRACCHTFVVQRPTRATLYLWLLQTILFRTHDYFCAVCWYLRGKKNVAQVLIFDQFLDCLQNFSSLAPCPPSSSNLVTLGSHAGSESDPDQNTLILDINNPSPSITSERVYASISTGISIKRYIEHPNTAPKDPSPEPPRQQKNQPQVVWDKRWKKSVTTNVHHRKCPSTTSYVYKTLCSICLNFM